MTNAWTDGDWPYDPAWRDTYHEVVQRGPGEPTPFREFTVEMIHRVWSGPELSVRDRRLVVLSILACRSAPNELAVHLRGALASGDLSVEELDALSVQLAMYAGWPMAAGLQSQLRQVREDLERDAV